MRQTTENYEIAHEGILNPRNTHEKKLETRELPTRKNSGPTNYLQERLCDPQTTREGTMALDPQD